MKGKKPIRKTILKRIINNSIIFVISIFLAFILFYLSKDTNIFQASILGIQDIKIIQENQRDIAYKNTDGLLDIFLSNNLLSKNYSSLDITIVYDYDTVSLNIQNISFQKQYKISFNQSGSITLSFDDLKDIKSQESFFIIPFSGSVKDILISEVIVKNGQLQDSLSIGNLTSYTEH
ncbi:MAG: hypothetical protein WAZ12_02410 [Candidatus Absconditicoccaceae bacterium]